MPVENLGTESNGMSSHGAIVRRNGTAIAELKDTTPPPLSRKTFDTSTHNSEDDSYVVGTRRKGEMQFMVNFLPSGDPTHNANGGLITAWAAGSKDKYECEYPDGAIWLFSGFVVLIAPKLPVEGIMEANVSIRPSGGQRLLP